jgi:uncharacterized protein DUF5302
MADAESEPEGSQDSSEDEIKRKFREALDRKRGKEAEANTARMGKDAGKIRGNHGPVRNRRSFRRKSGG